MIQKFYSLLFAMLFINVHTFAQITIKDGDLKDENYVWTNDNVYLLDGFVFLEAGGSLTIEQGTVIMGKDAPSTDDNTSALIITKGAQIFAEGTANQPIIFTSELDDINLADDLEYTDRGLWGGLIILGNAVIANTTPTARVEGIPEGEDRALFGGNNDEDSSGILKYVSIRHGGAELAPGNEINGLTLGAVGSGTQLEYIEVIANQDDGIEFFGGTVSLKNAIVAYAGDDAFDWDLGYRGNGQFWFAMLGENNGDNGGELDGAGGSDDIDPHSQPTIYNATFLGAGCLGNAGNNTAVLFRDGGGGKFLNSIFTEFNHAIEVEDKSGIDSRHRLEVDGTLALENNIWGTFCEGNTFSDIIRPTLGAPDVQWLIDYLGQAGNVIADPEFTISYEIDGLLDPRPGEIASIGEDGEVSEYPDNFFTKVCFKGAFQPKALSENTWLKGWTALSEYGILDPSLGFSEIGEQESCLVGTEELVLQNKGYMLFQNAPNPFSNFTEISFNLPTQSVVSLSIYDLNGRELKRIIDADSFVAGTHQIEINATQLASGLYYYKLSTPEVSLTKELVVIK